jgi:hypothetical protein
VPSPKLYRQLARVLSGNSLIEAVANSVSELTENHGMTADDAFRVLSPSGSPVLAGTSRRAESFSPSPLARSETTSSPRGDGQQRTAEFAQGYLPSVLAPGADLAAARDAMTFAMSTLDQYSDTATPPRKRSGASWARAKRDIQDRLETAVHNLYFPGKVRMYAREATRNLIGQSGLDRAASELHAAVFGAARTGADQAGDGAGESIAGEASDTAADTNLGEKQRASLKEIYQRYSHSHSILVTKFSQDHNVSGHEVYTLWMLQQQGEPFPHPKYGYMIKHTNDLGRRALSMMLQVVHGINGQAALDMVDREHLVDPQAMDNMPNYAADALSTYVKVVLKINIDDL